MENKKKIIIVIGILFAYFLIMVVVVGVDRVKNKFYHLELLISPNSYLIYENGYWKDAVDQQDLLGVSYHIYDNHQFLYDGVLQYTEETWYAFDKNNKPLTLPNTFLAYRGNFSVEVVDDYQISPMEETEKKEAISLLKGQHILFEPSFTKAEKVLYDLDQNGETEELYLVSNALGIEEQEIYFTIAYVKIGGKIQTLISDVSEDLYSVPSLGLKEILDYNHDHKYELIFEKIYFDQIGTCHQIFQFEKNEYQSVKDCELSQTRR